MTHVFKKSLMMAALVAAFAVAQAGTTMAQFSSAEAVPAAPAAPVGITQAFIDLGTGEITLDIGAGLQIFGLETLNTTGFFDNAVAGAAPNGLLAIDPIPPFPLGETQGPGTQNDAGGIGVLNTGFLPTGLFNLGSIIPTGLATADLVTAGLNLRFDGPGSPDAANAVASPSNIFIVNEPGPGPGPAIPEPGSLSLLALAGLGALARRRR